MSLFVRVVVVRVLSENRRIILGCVARAATGWSCSPGDPLPPKCLSSMIEVFRVSPACKRRAHGPSDGFAIGHVAFRGNCAKGKNTACLFFQLRSTLFNWRSSAAIE